MLNDSVLLSALIFFASSGIVWFYLVRVQKSNFKPKIKRILVYLSITIYSLEKPYGSTETVGYMLQGSVVHAHLKLKLFFGFLQH